MAALIKYKWLAALVGVLLAGVPVLLFTLWLHNQSEPEVLVEAKSSIRIAELAIDEAVNIRSDLAECVADLK